jgi:hypothetical protein
MDAAQICTRVQCDHEPARCAGCGVLVCKFKLDDLQECVWCERRRLREAANRARR